MNIKENYTAILARIESAARTAGRNPADITLLPVTKTRSAADINALLAVGAKGVGENRAQEWVAKRHEVANPGALHFIGQLQSNKVKYIIEDVALVHSVDRLSLAQEINRLAALAGKTVPVLAEINTAGQEHRGGIAAGEDDLARFLEELSALPALSCRGLMTIAPLQASAQSAFARMRKLGGVFEREMGESPILSMGMTDDFEQAIAEGSTLVRIGRALFQ